LARLENRHGCARRCRRAKGFASVKQIVREHRLSTVCEEAKCPNIGECWNAGTATVMLMGAVCTRACRFCAVDTGNPRGWLDPQEPDNVARSVELMKLKYVVLTSVDRDDLPDGGAAHYAAAIRAIKRRNPETAVEALTPDFQGVLRDVQTVVESGLEVFAQNVETVRRLTHPVRDPRAGYEQTLAVLRHAKVHRPLVLTKTSLMLGLGETDAEIRETMADLRAVGVDILTLGQYLRPTPNHLSVERFVTPEQFDRYREWALGSDFSNAYPVRWCVRATARSRRLPATTPDWITADSPDERCARDPPLRCGAVRADLAGDAAIYRRARAGHCGRDLVRRASAGIHPRLKCQPRALAGPPGPIPVVQIDRGGQVTYHGPGQLLIYPLIDLRRRAFGVHQLVLALENAVISYAAQLGVPARGSREAPGVYVEAPSSRASACGYAAAQAITGSRSTCRSTCSRSNESTCAATGA
jgi:lipoic acid synthetase